MPHSCSTLSANLGLDWPQAVAGDTHARGEDCTHGRGGPDGSRGARGGAAWCEHAFSEPRAVGFPGDRGWSSRTECRGHTHSSALVGSLAGRPGGAAGSVHARARMSGPARRKEQGVVDSSISSGLARGTLWCSAGVNLPDGRFTVDVIRGTSLGATSGIRAAACTAVCASPGRAGGAPRRVLFCQGFAAAVDHYTAEPPHYIAQSTTCLEAGGAREEGRIERRPSGSGCTWGA